jgi:6-phosphogluconolactonase (cycloisomerase 2 family)
MNYSNLMKSITIVGILMLLTACPQPIQVDSQWPDETLTLSVDQIFLYNADSSNFADAPRGTIVSADGLNVYLCSLRYFDSSYHGVLTVFSRNTTNGLLAVVRHIYLNNGITMDFVPNDLELSPDEKNLYITSNGPGGNALFIFTRNPVGGDLTYFDYVMEGVNGISGLEDWNGADVEISADGKFLYLTAQKQNNLFVFSRNTDTGELTYLNVYKDGVGGIYGLDGIDNIAISPDGNNIYATGLNALSLAVFNRDSDTGLLTFTTSFIDGTDGIDGLSAASDVIVSSDGKNVYVTSILYDDNIAIFYRNTSTGALTYKNCFKKPQTGNLAYCKSVVFSPDETHLFEVNFSNQGDNLRNSGISVFQRKPETGEVRYSFSLLDGDPGIDCLYGASFVSISPDGKNLYVSGWFDDTLVVLTIN